MTLGFLQPGLSTQVLVSRPSSDVLRAEWPSRPHQRAHPKSGSRCFSSSLRRQAGPAGCTLACPTLIRNRCGFGQRSAATMRLRPWRRLLASKQSGVSPPPPPSARSALRTPSQALRRRSDRSHRDRRLALPALPWERVPRAPQRPPKDPYSTSRAVPGGQGTRWRPSRSAQTAVALLEGLGTHPHPGAGRELGSAHQAPPLPVPAAVSGQGACEARQLLRPGETGESAPAGLAGVAGGGSVTPRLWARPVPAAHAPRAPPRPAPPACQPGRSRPSACGS